MTDEMRKRALALYRGPFKFDPHGGGYIWDEGAKGGREMVADRAGGVSAHDKEGVGAAARVRGWGRIGYMKDAAALHDAAGELIAEALTEYWERHAKKAREPESFPDDYEFDK